MRVEKIDIEKRVAFKPVTIQLTFESQKELVAFYCLCNYSPINDAVCKIGFLNFSAMRNALGLRGGYHAEFSAMVDYISMRLKEA